MAAGFTEHRRVHGVGVAWLFASSACGYVYAGPVSVAQLQADPRLEVYVVHSKQPTTRQHWISKGARISPRGDRILDEEGATVLELRATDELHAEGSYDVGETIPPGGVVTRPPADGFAALAWSGGFLASAAVFGVLLGASIQDCNAHAPECESATHGRGILWGLALALPFSTMLGTGTGIGMSLAPPLTISAGR